MSRSSFLLAFALESSHLDFELLEPVLDHVEVVLEPLCEQRETLVELVLFRFFFRVHGTQHLGENLSGVMKAQNPFPLFE